ncbi:MAG: IS91 family transposase [Chitinophagaceae bacterium]|jgi:hypothetical protein
MKATFEVADVLNKCWDQYKSVCKNTWQIRTLNAIRRCRTASMGGHVDACSSCGNITISYNSCRNRHCPKCQGNKRQQWIEARESELLPVKYFHVVFTLPEIINKIAIYEPRIIYDTLFEAAWKTIEIFSKDEKYLGAKSGMISILHTWGQNLMLHPHLHCIVPGGGVDAQGKWLATKKSNGKWLFPVKAMSKIFRAKYVSILRNKIKLEQSYYNDMFKSEWVVFAKRPFGSPKSVIEYLGRYTHKIAISNHRIISINDESVTFTLKDYKNNGIRKTMTISHLEFVRRFVLHILPKKFVRIRHFGFLSSTWKREKLKNLQNILKVTPVPKKENTLPPICPCCKEGVMVTIVVFGSRGPPEHFLSLAQEPKLSIAD